MGRKKKEAKSVPEIVQGVLDLSILQTSIISKKPSDPAIRSEALTILHSSLFTAANTKTPRKLFDGAIIPVTPNAKYSIRYTGVELRVIDDEDVWINIIYYAQKQKIHNHDFTIEVRTSEFLRTMNWGSAGLDYNKLRESLRRLKSASLEINNEKNDGYGLPSLIRKYFIGKKGDGSKLTIVLEPDIYKLYSESHTISLDFRIRQSLSILEKKAYSLIVIGKLGKIHLSDLMLLMGVHYKEIRQFKAKLKQSLDVLIKHNTSLKGYSFDKENFAYFSYSDDIEKALAIDLQ